MEYVRPKDELQDVFWYRVDDLLSKKGKTLQEMAEATEIKYNTLLGWRANKRLPDLRSAVLIANFFDVNVEYLCGNRSKKTEIEKDFNEIIESSSDTFRKMLKETGRDETLPQMVHEFAKFFDELRITACAKSEEEMEAKGLNDIEDDEE